jgi:3',5'-cyclic-AMP phosphodiesterase
VLSRLGRYFRRLVSFQVHSLNEAAPNHEGLLCDERPGFLEQAPPQDRPLLLFRNRPPFDTGLGYMDTTTSPIRKAEWDLPRRCRLGQLRHI